MTGLTVISLLKFVSVAVIRRFVLSPPRLEPPQLYPEKSFREITTELFAVGEHLSAQVAIAVEAFLLDIQLPIYAVQTVKFGTIRAEMSLGHHFLAD